MNFYIKQKVFSIGDKFTIYDEEGNDAFYVEGEIFTWGKRLHLYSLSGEELSFIQQKVFSFLPKYYIYRNGYSIAEVVKKFTFFIPAYNVKGLDLDVEGNFLAREYVIKKSGREVGAVSKEWFTLGDAYMVSISDTEDVVNVLSVVLVIDACISQARNN